MTALRRMTATDPALRVSRPVEPGTLAEAAAIVEAVRRGGEQALRDHAVRFGEITPDGPLVLDRAALELAYAGLDDSRRQLLDRVAGRIGDFALAQMTGAVDLTVPVPGGAAGHRWIPVSSAGAYAPGGRHPLPSTVLMTVTPARTAGVGTVWTASPRPTEVTKAAAWVAGADGLLAAGGAHAIAALAFGTATPTCDLIVGPGNRWVTAAKKHLYGEVGIDGLAGPSEIVVIADEAADPVLVAADLVAQAEHDVDAVPGLVTTSDDLATRVDGEIRRHLGDLPTSTVATAALANGFCVVVDHLEEAVGLANELAPEHLALHVEDPTVVGDQLTSYGAVFLGGTSGETFADYGAGPNHVLPTGRGARFQSGLSVFTFLKSPTWLRLDRPEELVADTALLARLEGLEAHARAAEARLNR
jgi:histidinol dehydrogenase